MKPSIVIVGAGKVGTALGVLLRERGYPVVGIASRTRASAEAAARRVDPTPETSVAPESLTPSGEVILLTTRDDVIQEVCATIADRGGFRSGQVVLHVSGSVPSDALDAARKAGCAIGSMHPLQSFADVDVAIQRLKGAFFCLEGDTRAIEVAKNLAEALGGRVMTIQTEDKPIYHAAAVIASNFFVSLIDMSLRFYEAIGIDREKGLEALMPLIEGSLANIKALGPVKALTGPIARGDVGVVKKHLEAIGRVLPDMLPIYDALARLNVDVGIRKGTLREEAAREILGLLKS